MEQFIEKIKNLSTRTEQIKDTLNTEEATKTALIMPFFQLLGYDVFNPLEFTPEFTADVGIKKGEKVDYAILQDNEPVILIECKSVTEKLDNHDSQLFRYFATTSSKFGILTNGLEYRFYTDLEEKNKMDSKPFFTFDILNLKDNKYKELFKFTKDNFEVENISNSAYELKYINAIKELLAINLSNPSEEFVKYILSEVYESKRNKQTIERFTPIVKDTFKIFISEQVNAKLNAALNNNKEDNVKVVEETIEEATAEVVTTQEELEAFAIVKVLLSDVVDVERIFYRDNRSYFNIILDDNIRKWLFRIYLGRTKNYIELNDDNKTRIDIDTTNDIIKHAEALKNVVANVDK